MFDVSAGSDVLLIRKTKPAWQAGRLNGVGGKIEKGESALEAMVREFREEACRETLQKDWTFFYTLTDRDCTFAVHFFSSVTLSKEGISACTEEELVWHRAHALPYNVIPNLRWLIPMSRDIETWRYAGDKMYPTMKPWRDTFRPV